MVKNCKRLFEDNLGQKKYYFKEKEISYISIGKDMIILLIFGLVKVIQCKMSQYFPKPFINFGENINVKVNLSDYATKTYPT